MLATTRRQLTWLAVGLVVGVAGGLILLAREPAEPLTSDALAQARRLWEAHRPGDYALELEVLGALSDRRSVEVRDGEVVAMTTGSVEASRSAWPYWSVDALFDMLDTELANAARPLQAYGVRDSTRIVMRVRFHPELGYPAYYLRHVMGSRQQSGWKVVGFDQTPEGP